MHTSISKSETAPAAPGGQSKSLTWRGGAGILCSAAGNTPGGMARKPRQDREVATVFRPCLSGCCFRRFFPCFISRPHLRAFSFRRSLFSFFIHAARRVFMQPCSGCRQSSGACEIYPKKSLTPRINRPEFRILSQNILHTWDKSTEKSLHPGIN